MGKVDPPPHIPRCYAEATKKAQKQKKPNQYA